MPDSFSRRQGDIGAPIERFDPGMANALAGIILAVLCLAAGLGLGAWLVWVLYSARGVLPWSAEREMSWESVGRAAFCDVVLLGSSGFLFWFVNSFWFDTTVVCENGLSDVQHHHIREITWDEIAVIREGRLPGSLHLVIEAQPRDGEVFRFTYAGISDMPRFRQLLFEKATAAGVEWRTEFDSESR